MAMMPHCNYHVGLSKHKIPLDSQTLSIENDLSIPCEPKLTFLNELGGCQLQLP
jgi:hypothetical protein